MKEYIQNKKKSIFRPNRQQDWDSEEELEWYLSDNCDDPEAK
jgi:hypothetical protein